VEDFRCSLWPAMAGNRGDCAMNSGQGRSLVRERARESVISLHSILNHDILTRYNICKNLYILGMKLV
jgi:hypothetical protein